MNEPQQVTVYCDGRFTTETTPEWWQAEYDRLFPLAKGAKPVPSDKEFGDEHCHRIEVWRLPQERGYVVDMVDTVEGIIVWMPTAADYLNFATTRMGAWLALSSDQPVAASLQAISNTLIAYARHGKGEHVDRWGLGNEIDAKRDRMAQQRNRTLAKA